MYREKCVVLENKKVAPGHYVLTCASRAISKSARPGQFAQVLCEESNDPLLPRPFSFLTATQNNFSILYHVVGKGTASLAQKKKGDFLWVLAPLGNGFTLGRKTMDERRGETNIVLVGGGVGIPPLYHLAQQVIKRKLISSKNIRVFLGARHKSFLLCEKDFEKLGVRLEAATDDGSKGYKGFVTNILEDFLLSPIAHRPSPLVYACGPTPMLKAVSLVSQKYEVPCEVSVEVPMACGFGACIGCAIKVNELATCGAKATSSRQSEFILRRGGPAATKDPKNYRFAIACTEGPVFQAKDIIWD